MSILLTGLVVGCSALVGRVLGRQAIQAFSSKTSNREEPKAERPSTPPTAAPKAKAPPDLALFPCHLGDVVVRTGAGDEAWLAGGIVLSEGAPVAVIFFAPEAGGDRALLALPKPDDELVWLTPVPESEVSIGVEPPNVVEHKNDRFERTRRLPLHAERIGAGAPDLGAELLFADYRSGSGDRLIVVVPSSGTARVFRGERLLPGMFDVLEGGHTT